MKAFRLALLTALLVLLSLPSAGSPFWFHPEVERARAALAQARGPEVYAALRRIWRAWDRAEPSQVEELLLSAERDPKLAPPARAYAGLLAAHARLRRGDLSASSAKIRSLGYVGRWLVIGPFDNEQKAGIDQDFGIESELGRPIVLGRAYAGKERPVRWRQAPERDRAWLDVGALVRPDRNVCAYARAYVHGTDKGRAPRPLTLWVGASGAFRALWNGVEVLRDTAYRGWDADRLAAPVTLAKGENELTVKICGDDRAPLFSVRIGDERGGPAGDIEIVATLDHGASTKLSIPERPVAKGVTVPPKPAVAAKARVEGPLQSFAKLAAAPKPAPRDLASFAAYLDQTDGDDPAKHEARDFARRSADAEPTVERLLLAARLSEDRNQRAGWIDRAEALAPSDPDVVLARAGHLRTGPNPTEALPLFERVLAADPDRPEAILGKAELLDGSGLRRTALSTLEAAVARNPHAVLLLSAYASELSAVGRTTEAGEAEDAYSALRFDDSRFLASRLDLAVLRRDLPSAEHWADRLRALEPTSQWALGAVARAYRKMGAPERAVAMHRAALDVAPEDVGTMRSLADLLGELGARDEQLDLLRGVLRIRPQDKEVREYVEHFAPDQPRIEESFAWASERFLRLRHAPPRGDSQRTLLDLTVSRVFENGLSSQFRQIVFQPLTDSAAALGRQYAFQYQADRQRVQLRGARVFRSDGRVDEAIESGEGAADDPEIAMYTSGRTFYVSFPRLEPGDVVELRYRVDDFVIDNEFSDYFGEVALLQSGEPVSHAEYVLVGPKSRTFQFDLMHLSGVQRATSEVGDLRVNRFSIDDVPGIQPEPAMPPWPEVLGGIHVSTYRDWKEVGRWYWSLVKDQLDLDDATRKLAREIAKDAKTDVEKVKAVYRWVIDNTRYVALEFGIYGYKPHRCVQTVTRGWGDCKDKATVIVTLLEELGVPATLVILRTQLRGDFRSTVASLAPFDHAIAYVPSLDLYLDGTAELTGIHELPAPDLGALGLRVNRGDADLVVLPPGDADQNVVSRTVHANLKRDGQARLEVDVVARGVEAPAGRRRYGAASTRRDRVAEDLARELNGFRLDPGPAAVTAEGLEDFEVPARIAAKGIAPTFARREGDRWSMSVTSSLRLTPRFASLSERKLDVRADPPRTVEDTFVIDVPPGLRVASAPPDVHAEGPFGAYSVSSSVVGRVVTVKSRVLVRARRIPPEKYREWKEFCVAADQALVPRLVLEAE